MRNCVSTVMPPSRMVLRTWPIMYLTLLCLVILFRAASAQEAEGKAIERTELGQDVARLLADHHIPGVSIAQIKGGRLVRASAHGQQSSDVSATPDTLYNIASLTKPISAEVVLRLVSKRVISLDEPMYKYWSDPDIAHDERRKLLTPRIALSHQTGFANWRSETGNVLTFRNDPGKTFGYSGEGYEYLAHFLEKKTGNNLEDHARELVFKPARMEATAYTRQPWFEGRVAVPADAEGRWLKPTFASKPIASDLMYTTAADYARFLLQVMKDEGITQAVATQRARVHVSLRDKMCQSIPSEICPDELGRRQVYGSRAKRCLCTRAGTRGFTRSPIYAPQLARAWSS